MKINSDVYQNINKLHSCVLMDYYMRIFKASGFELMGSIKVQ